MDKLSKENIGNKLRRLRQEHKLPLRKVAAQLDMDTAILSKMERGKRRLTKEIVCKLAEIYKSDIDRLMVLYLSEKILSEISGEPLARKALEVAEERVAYQAFQKTDRKKMIAKIKTQLSMLGKINKAWIYGSFSRGDDDPFSDIDIAVKTGKGFSYFDLAEIQHTLESKINRKVDVGFIDSFKPYIMEHIKPDLKLIYERQASGQ